MGTRNITKVIKDGNVMVCQYGQWDGHPTYTGANICEFVKKTDMNTFGKLLEEKTSFNDKPMTEEEEKRFDVLNEKCQRLQEGISDAFGHYAYSGLYESIRTLVKFKLITKEDAIFLCEYHRDTGFHILNAIMDFDGQFRLIDAGESDLMFFGDLEEKSRLIHMGGFSVWIEGVYTINLDAEVVEMEYHGNRMEYPFEYIKNEMDIKKEMRRFEEMDE